MMKIFLWILLIFPLNALSLNECFNGAVNGAFNGVWLFDEDESDDAKSLLNRQKNIQKQQQRVLNHVGRQYEDETDDLSLANNIPDYVFLEEDLKVGIEGIHVLFEQSSLRRALTTDGLGQGKSLKALKLEGDTRVASWENEILVIETMTSNGSKVSEKVYLEDLNTLFFEIAILTPLNEVLTMEKSYQRKDKIKECTKRKN